MLAEIFGGFEVYRQVGDIAALHLHQVSSKSGLMGPSYGQKTVSTFAEGGGVSEGSRPPYLIPHLFSSKSIVMGADVWPKNQVLVGSSLIHPMTMWVN